jgi:hypothetical protein
LGARLELLPVYHRCCCRCFARRSRRDREREPRIPAIGPVLRSEFLVSLEIDIALVMLVKRKDVANRSSTRASCNSSPPWRRCGRDGPSCATSPPRGVLRAFSGFPNGPLCMLVSAVCRGRQHASSSVDGHFRSGFGAFRPLLSASLAPGSRNLTQSGHAA